MSGLDLKHGPGISAKFLCTPIFRKGTGSIITTLRFRYLSEAPVTTIALYTW